MDIEEVRNKILVGDALDILREMPDNSVDTVITDPPYGLSKHDEKIIRKVMSEWLNGNDEYIPKTKGFMGRGWDAFVPPPALWKEVLRVMKHGGTALVFAGSRTQDLMTMSMRLAGFEIKDTLMWLYGSGFPKAQDISKMLDKKLGATRKKGKLKFKGGTQLGIINDDRWKPKDVYEEYPATPEAQKWEGYKTHALKPAYEPIIMAMKPNEGSYAENALKWGVAGLNIDVGRIGTEKVNVHDAPKGTFAGGEQGRGSIKNYREHQGRFPANILLDEESAKMLDEQAPNTGAYASVKQGHSGKSRGIYGDYEQRGDDGATFYNDGLEGASRFFYTAKAPKKERNMGLPKGMKNTHPTVKPISFMEYLIKLTKMPNENQIYLDPFIGTGTTAIAVLKQGRSFVGTESDEETVKIAKMRIAPFLTRKIDEYMGV